MLRNERRFCRKLAAHYTEQSRVTVVVWDQEPSNTDSSSAALKQLNKQLEIGSTRKACNILLNAQIKKIGQLKIKFNKYL